MPSHRFAQLLTEVAASPGRRATPPPRQPQSGRCAPPRRARLRQTRDCNRLRPPLPRQGPLRSALVGLSIEPQCARVNQRSPNSHACARRRNGLVDSKGDRPDRLRARQGGGPTRARGSRVAPDPRALAILTPSTHVATRRPSPPGPTLCRRHRARRAPPNMPSGPPETASDIHIQARNPHDNTRHTPTLGPGSPDHPKSGARGHWRRVTPSPPPFGQAIGGFVQRAALSHYTCGPEVAFA